MTRTEFDALPELPRVERIRKLWDALSEMYPATRGTLWESLCTERRAALIAIMFDAEIVL